MNFLTSSQMNIELAYGNILVMTYYTLVVINQPNNLGFTNFSQNNIIRINI